jgi:hypothetical protein
VGSVFFVHLFCHSRFKSAPISARRSYQKIRVGNDVMVYAGPDDPLYAMFLAPVRELQTLCIALTERYKLMAVLPDIGRICQIWKEE